MFRMSKKEARFYEMFISTTEMAIETSKSLEGLMNDFTEIPTKVQEIEDLEHKCDMHMHNILKHLNASFITPIDREDIYLIAKELDNIVDAIEEIAHRFVMFNVDHVKDEAKAMAHYITLCVEQLNLLMKELQHMKGSKTLKPTIIEVNRLENEGKKIFRQAVTKLFAEEKDPIEIIKWRGIFGYLEDALDACEDVANIVEGVVMKHA